MPSQEGALPSLWLHYPIPFANLVFPLKGTSFNTDSFTAYTECETLGYSSGQEEEAKNFFLSFSSYSLQIDLQDPEATLSVTAKIEDIQQKNGILFFDFFLIKPQNLNYTWLKKIETPKENLSFKH